MGTRSEAHDDGGMGETYADAAAERNRYQAALEKIKTEAASAHHARSIARAALDEQHGPRPACPECGMGGDVGGTEPNHIPF